MQPKSDETKEYSLNPLEKERLTKVFNFVGKEECVINSG